MVTQIDIGKTVARARRAEETAQRKTVERRAVQACEATGISHDELGVEFFIGLFMLAKEMDRGQRDNIAARGAAEVARLLGTTDALAAAAPELAQDPELEEDLHAAFSNIPSDDLAAALTERSFVCYSDKRLSAKKPRTWQGRGKLAEIQALVGTSAAVFVKAKPQPQLGLVTASARTEGLSSAAPIDGHETGEPAVQPQSRAETKDWRPCDYGADYRIGLDADCGLKEDALAQPPEMRCSASSKVGAVATAGGA